LATFVTGGTGFIGSKLVGRLRQDGEIVHLLARKTSDLTGVAGEGVEVFYGDLGDLDALRAATAGCRRAFHLAAYARNWAPECDTYYRVNVEGFANVATAALETGVERMVWTSTCLTVGPSNGHVVDESSPRLTDEFLTDYERTKYLAEARAAEFVARGLPVVIVNPTRVYGPGRLTEANSATLLVQMFLRGRFPIIPGRGDEIGNYVFVDDVVEGHLAAMARGRVGERYLLAGENASLTEFFQVLSELSGRRPPRFHVPRWLIRRYSHIELWRARLFGSYPLITPGWMATFLTDWAVSNRKAVTELGCTFRGLREGLAATCDWLAKEGTREP